MPNYLDKNYDIILNNRTSNDLEIRQHIKDAGEELYTDSPAIAHDVACMLYININLIEHMYYFDDIEFLNKELLSLIEGAKLQGDADNYFYDEVLILFKVKATKTQTKNIK